MFPYNWIELNWIMFLNKMAIRVRLSNSFLGPIRLYYWAFLFFSYSKNTVNESLTQYYKLVSATAFLLFSFLFLYKCVEILGRYVVQIWFAKYLFLLIFWVLKRLHWLFAFKVGSFKSSLHRSFEKCDDAIYTIFLLKSSLTNSF